MSQDTPEVKPVGYECRFAVYCPPNEGDSDDYHLVKEQQHLPDGSTRPAIRLIKNYRRPFWVTKKGCQNHQDKKEWEDLDKVDRFECTQTQLQQACARALGMPWFKGDLRKLSASPYLYGADILSTAVIKQYYRDNYPDLNTPYTVAAFDTETDVVRGTEEIIMATIAMGGRVFTAIQEVVVHGYANVHERLNQLFHKYLGAFEVKKKDGTIEIVDWVSKRKLTWDVMIVKRDVDVIKECFRRAHEWKPDFLAIWNIDFDVPRMVRTLEKHGIDPAEVFSDPSVPRAYKHFKYVQGPKQKRTASGKVMPIKPAAQWHTVYCPASFYFIDAMCAYRHIRTGSAEEPSYGLDPILKKHEIGGKLKFEEGSDLPPLDWHQFMQTQHPLEYVIYNVFDCVSMLALDEKTMDLAISLPLYSGASDFCNFKSQPRRTADRLHYFCLQNKLVIGTTCSEMATEFDKETIGLDGWIVTLPAHTVLDNGLQVIEECPDMRTNIRGHVGDLDVSASYPNGEVVFNISKATTKKELLKIQGVSEHTQRMQGINLSAGHVNAVEIATGLFNLPSLETLLTEFVQQSTTIDVSTPQLT